MSGGLPKDGDLPVASAGLRAGAAGVLRFCLQVLVVDVAAAGAFSVLVLLSSRDLWLLGPFLLAALVVGVVPAALATAALRAWQAARPTPATLIALLFVGVTASLWGLVFIANWGRMLGLGSSTVFVSLLTSLFCSAIALKATGRQRAAGWACLAGGVVALASGILLGEGTADTSRLVGLAAFVAAFLVAGLAYDALDLLWPGRNRKEIPA